MKKHQGAKKLTIKKPVQIKKRVGAPRRQRKAGD